MELKQPYSDNNIDIDDGTPRHARFDESSSSHLDRSSCSFKGSGDLVVRYAAMTRRTSKDSSFSNSHESKLNATLDPISQRRKRHEDHDHLGDEILAKKQTQSLLCLRSFTGMTLFSAAILICSLTYLFSRRNEVKDFQQQYDDITEAFENIVRRSLQNKVYSAMTLSAMYTSVFGPQKMWPNATMYDFEKLAKGQLAVAESIGLSFNPIITNENRGDFEAHAAQKGDLLGVSELESNYTIYTRENGVVVDDPGIQPNSPFPGVMIPVYQIYPAEDNRKAIMFNLHSEENRMRALDDMMLYKVPTLTALLHLVQHPEAMNPSSILFYPVFSQFDDDEVVGSISIVFTWEAIFETVLTEDYEGLTVVLESSASMNLDPDNGVSRQLWTFDILGGEDITFSEGDLHDPSFDEYQEEISLNVAQGTISGLANVDNLITFKIRLYPSLKMQNLHLTDNPMTYVVSLLGIFIFVSAVFLAYDRLQMLQKDKILTLAKKSGQIVDSLFPISVKERLYYQSEHVNKKFEVTSSEPQHKDKDPFRRDSSTSDLSPVEVDVTKMEQFKRFLRRQLSSTNRKPSQELNVDTPTGPLKFCTPPIADLFSETSVMFADVVGFTKWSSDREPEDVFHFLESLYFEFDKISEQLGVFKLGTIGDCYIAVTGIPEYRPDHAVIMCRFAHECRLVLKRVFQELDNTCGMNTGNLSMRFGVNSGPVTAGVLRGKKSRFELFGDTINTASRMETTSKPEMIQISQTTANYLLDAGHSDWFEPRYEEVEVKGKGKLQTYWLSIENNEADDMI
jgi:class 3 adenylate cyclase